MPQELEVLVYQRLQKKLVGLGRLRHEMLGVNYVDTEWGLMVIPPIGYQEMKVNFFHHTSREKIREVLTDIEKILKNPD